MQPAANGDPAAKRTAIVGGGMLGLALALRLLEQGEHVTILEAAPELGGLTVPFAIGDFTWDRFYHIIVPRDRRLLALLADLGLESEIKWSTPKTAFYTDGGFHSISNVFDFLSFKPLNLIDKVRLGVAILCAEKLADPLALEDVTAEHWLTRICGRRTFEKIWRPLLRAKLGNSYPDVSAAFIWATIVRYYGARKGGVGRDECGYVAGGYARILRVLVDRLNDLGVETVLGSKIAAIRRGPSGPEIEFARGERREFDRVVVTIAAPLAARLCVDLSGDELQRLGSKRYMGIVCVSVVLDRPLGPYYVTNLTDDWVPFSAVIDMSAVVDRGQFNGRGLVYLPKYVDPADPLFAREDGDIVAEFVAALERMYPDFCAGRVVDARVSRAPAVFAMPTLGYSQSLPAIATSVPGLYTVNSAQIVNATLVVDETLGLADRALDTLAEPSIAGESAGPATPAPAPATPAGAQGNARPSTQTPRLVAATQGLSAYIAGALLWLTAYNLWQQAAAGQPPALWIGLACAAFGLGLLCYGSLERVAGYRKENWAVGGVLFAFVAYAATWVGLHIGAFGSDALLFNVYSALIASHGGNPYVHSMEPAFGLFNVSKDLVTPTAGGGAIYLQSYPALSFLLYVPFLRLGIDPQCVDVIAHVGLMLILVWAAPRPLKALAPLVLFVDRSYSDYTLGGVTDIVWVVLIALAARFWNSKPVLTAIVLGLACAAKQPPWFVAPFALVAWASTALERRRPGQFFAPFAAFVLAFVIPNLPYMLAGWSFWLRGILTPIEGNLLAFGSGALQLVTAGIYTIDMRTLSLVSSAVLGILLVVYAIDRRRLGFLPFLAPGIALFFATRELQNYFMWWPAVLIVYGFAPPAEASQSTRPISRPRAALAPAVALALSLVLAGFLITRVHSGPQSVRVSILKSEYDPVSGNVNAFVVRLVNPDPDRQRAVRLGVQLQGHGDDFHYWLQTPLVVGAGQESTYRVVAPSASAQLPPAQDTGQVVAIDAASGTQTYSAPLLLIPYFAGLANGLLADWEPGPPATPSGWSFTLSDFTTGDLARGVDHGAPHLSFNVPPRSDVATRVVAVSQDFTGIFHRLRVRLKPLTNSAGAAGGRSMFGVRLTDATGRIVYYIIDPGLRAPTLLEQGRDAVIAVPGRLGRWNTIVLDGEDLAARLQFTETSSLEFAIVAIAQREDPEVVRGDFGGVTSE